MMPRMRTIDECARMIKEEDPDTAMTKNALRTMVLTGHIPHVTVGNKRLINYDKLIQSFDTCLEYESVPTHVGLGGIRQVQM